LPVSIGAVCKRTGATGPQVAPPLCPTAPRWSSAAFNSHVDPVKTGSLWRVVKLYETPVQGNAWSTVRILVKGQNIVVRVNGKIVADYTEPQGATGPRRLGKGYFALQQHDPGSSVRYRNIKIRRLPD
jgi:hypothetical protein